MSTMARMVTIAKTMHRSLNESAIAGMFIEDSIFELWEHALEANSMYKIATLHMPCTEDSVSIAGCKNANLSHCNQHKSVFVHQNYRRQISRIFNYILSYS